MYLRSVLYGSPVRYADVSFVDAVGRAVIVGIRTFTFNNRFDKNVRFGRRLLVNNEKCIQICEEAQRKDLKKNVIARLFLNKINIYLLFSFSTMHRNVINVFRCSEKIKVVFSAAALFYTSKLRNNSRSETPIFFFV